MAIIVFHDCAKFPTILYYGVVPLWVLDTLILMFINTIYLLIIVLTAPTIEHFDSSYASIVHSMYYIVSTIVERDTGKYHEFIAEYCYECEARVTILRQWMSDVSQVSRSTMVIMILSYGAIANIRWIERLGHSHTPWKQKINFERS